MADQRTVERSVSRRHFLGASAAASFAAFSSFGPVGTAKDQPLRVAATQEKPTDQTLADLYREAAQILFQARPICATLFGLSDEEVGQHYANCLPDYSPKAEQRLRQQLLQFSSRIEDYRLTSASQSEEETRVVMTHLMRDLSGHPGFSVGITDAFGISPFPVCQSFSPPTLVFLFLQNNHQIRNERDAQDYVERLAKFDAMFSSLQEKVQYDSAQNWIPPKIVLERAVDALDKIQKPAPTQHPLVNTLAKKLETLDGVSGERKEALVAQARRNVEDAVCPAYRSLIEQAEGLLAKARDEAGIWAQPNGEEFYQDLIRQAGGSDLGADEIHTLGLSEVERLTDAMDALLTAQGYREGTVAQRMAALNDEPRFLYPDTEDGRKQLIDDLNQRIEEVTAKMTALSRAAPSQRVEVRPIPVEIQDGAPPAMYGGPTPNDDKPAVFMINLRDMKAHPKFSLPTLVYHEGVPGHHWQISLAMGLKDVPLLRRTAVFMAYAEGWALYAEQLAAEMGLYEDDPFGNLGRLQAELWRSVRLVVDTGLHHKRWTREKAIQYMSDTTGLAESAVTAEIERYMAMPAQALAYKLGMRKMLELRDKAKTQLGQRFDLAEFHDVILLGGAMPLHVLEKRVDSWIAANRPA